MNIGEIGTVFGICATLVGGTATGGKYYMEHEMQEELKAYVPISSLLKKELRSLKKELRGLEYESQHRDLSDRELWELEQLYQDIEEVERELND